MRSNEGQPAETETKDSYEATVLDFLDREMATVREAQKKNQQSDEVDALVSDLLKQVITESDQTKAADKPLFDEDELFAGLPAAHPSSSSATEDKEATVAKPADPPHFFSSTANAKSPEEAGKSAAPGKQKPEGIRHAFTSSPVFGSGITPQKKKPVLAIAAAALFVIVAASMYFFSGSSDTAPVGTGSKPTVVPSLSTETPAAPASAAKRPASAPANKSAASPVSKSGSASAPSKQASGKAVPAPQTAPPAAKPGLSKPQPEPSTAVAPRGASEEGVVAQPAPITPIPVPVAATIEKPAAPTATESPAPAAPAAPERKTAPPPQPAAAVSETPVASSQPAPAAAPVNTLVAAVPILQTTPVYPELALRARASGSVVLELQIDDQGKVVKATPVSGPPILHNAAVTAAMKWRYRPASIGGVNVSSQSRVTMAFNLKR